MRTSWIALVLTHALAAGAIGGQVPAVASAPSTRPAASAAEIARLVGQLGAGDARQRNEAQKALEKIGEPAVGELEKAARDGNLERAMRAKAALDEIHLIPRLRADLAKVGLDADKHTFNPDKTGLAIIGQLEKVGAREACEVLLEFIQTPRQDRLLRKEAVCALGRIGTSEALKCLGRFHAWADRRLAAREGEFAFGRWDNPCEHFSGEELSAWLTAKDAKGTEWVAFVWNRLGYGIVWVTRPLGKDKWQPPVMTDLTRRKLAERTDLTLHISGDGLRIKSHDGAIDVPAALLEADGDADGLPDAVEAILGTDPKKADTDGDGLADGKDADPTVPANPRPAENDMIRQAVFYAVYSTCDSWTPIYMPKDGREFKGYRGGIVRTARLVPGRFNVSIEDPEIKGDSATVRFSDYYGSEAAAAYRAQLKKVDDTWVVVTVEMLAIS